MADAEIVLERGEFVDVTAPERLVFSPLEENARGEVVRCAPRRDRRRLGHLLRQARSRARLRPIDGRWQMIHQHVSFLAS